MGVDLHCSVKVEEKREALHQIIKSLFPKVSSSMKSSVIMLLPSFSLSFCSRFPSAETSKREHRQGQYENQDKPITSSVKADYPASLCVAVSNLSN